MPVSELRDALTVALALGSLIWAASAAYRGITHRLDAIGKDLLLLSGQTRERMDAHDRRVTELERRVRDLQNRHSHATRRRDPATD